MNIDDYHDCHEIKVPNITSLQRICHMCTTLINTPNIPPVPIKSNGDLSIYRNGLLDPLKLNVELKNQMKKNLLTYNKVKIKSSGVVLIENISEEELAQALSVHV